jgi:DNA-binding NarL/FixJ family response regulator
MADLSGPKEPSMCAFPASRNAVEGGACDPCRMVLRCLIVDDSLRFLEAARGLLEREGVAVVGVASTSAEALRQAEELKPDVTLVDVDLGHESGFELVRRLHSQTSLNSSRAILISTYAEEDFADLIPASPAAGFLSKSDLSARAIREILGTTADGDPGQSRSR